MAAKKKAAVKRKRRTARPPPVKKPQMMIVTEQQTDIRQVVVPPGATGKKGKVWEAVSTLREMLFYGAWIGVGLSFSPLPHTISHFYCGIGDNARCTVIEYPAWLELVGLIVAMAGANAAKDVVSKSLKQIVESVKDAPGLISRSLSASGRRHTAEERATGERPPGD